METNLHLLICRWWLLILICASKCMVVVVVVVVFPGMALWDPDFEKYSSSQVWLKKNNPIKTLWNPLKTIWKHMRKLWNPMKNEIFTISIERWIISYPSLGIKRHILSWLGCPSSPPKRIVFWFYDHSQKVIGSLGSVNRLLLVKSAYLNQES